MALSLTVDGNAQPARTLGLETTETIRIPLAQGRDTTATLEAGRDYPLGAPDTRLRSYRVVNIDFD
jgi:hypothetical protein